MITMTSSTKLMSVSGLYAKKDAEPSSQLPPAAHSERCEDDQQAAAQNTAARTIEEDHDGNWLRGHRVWGVHVQVQAVFGDLRGNIGDKPRSSGETTR